MSRYGVHFSRLDVGAEFAYNGNMYKKRSTRTAEIIQPECYAGRWFYFGQNDQCVIKRDQLTEIDN